MKKKFTFLIAALMLLTMINLPGKAVGQAKTTTYKLTQVTSVSAGNKYVFVRDSHALSNTIDSKALQTTDSYSTTNLEGNEVFVWTLEAATGGFYLKNVSLSSNQYINNSSKTDMAFGDKSAIWSISFSNGTALISNTSNSNRFLGDSGKETPNHKYKAYATSNIDDYQHDFTVYLLEEESDEPTITVLPTSLTGLSYNHGTGPSTSKTFTVSGTNLTTNISITAPTHYEVCTTQNGTYSGSITLTQAAGTVSNTTIYARLKAGQNVGNYNSENVTLASTGATQKTVSLSGTVSGYTVTYNCNGGSGGPANENNVPSGDFIISSTEPTKTNYTFGGWNDGTKTYAASATYPLTGNVTLTAQWIPVTYAYAIDVTGPDSGATASVSVGGVTLDENAEIDYNAEVTINVSVSAGYGYSISVVDSEDNNVDVDDENKFTMPASEVYIYITTEVNPYLQAKLSGTKISEMSNSGSGYGTLKSITFNGLTWQTTGYQTSTLKNMIQLRTNNNPYIQLPIFNGKIKEISFKVTGASNSDSSYEEGSATSTQLVFKTATDGSAIASSESSSLKLKTIDLSTSFYTTGYIMSTGGVRVWEITVIYLPYGNFTPWNPESTLPSTLSDGANIAISSNMSTENLTIPAKAALVVKSGASLTLTGTLTNNGTAANLVIEDGAQLFFHDNGAKDAVQATVKKNISAATNWGTESNGWNFIASPLSSNTTPASVANMITADIEEAHTYDLYRYDGSKPKDYWENYRNEEHTDGFNLVNGQGYLYANQSDVTLEFAGTIQPSDEKEITGLNSGYNLVGNPFTCNARLNVSYYKLNATGDVILSESVAGSNPIAPCTGVIISGSSVTFTPTTDDAVSSPGKGNVEMVLAQTVATRNGENTTTIDNAIVSFNEGSELPKFYFGTQNANIYIPMDNEEYAIVSSNGQGEMPVNFRAYVAGEYTITVNPEEVEMGYLHLIDNIAGKDVDLLANPSYTFNARTDDYESRFRLVFSTTMVNAEMGEDFAFMSDGQLVIANEGEATLQVIDVTGRVVATENINGTCSMAINAKAGVYVLRLINGTDVKTQKMVIR
ncbi:MAG: InlB B-repeat-containing protein [Bacteroidales bacterium]|nr:InlB B-repeat-containing protein [Bacteroidales bacterium]